MLCVIGLAVGGFLLYRGLTGEDDDAPGTIAMPDVTTLTLEEASAFMPAHGHGSNPPEILQTEDGYAIDKLVFFMSGRWEVTLNFKDRGTPDKLSFGVDVN